MIPSYVYGIDDNNVIWQIDPVGETFSSVYSTPLITDINTSNAFAFDRGRDHMFFLNRSGTFVEQPYTQGLSLWNKPAGTFSLLGSGATIGNPGTGTVIPANAAFYGDAFWYFQENTFDLYKVALTYSEPGPGGVPTGVAGVEQFVMNTGTASIASTNNAFGDIAIDVDTGVLYAYLAGGTTGNAPSGRFYTLNLKNPTGGVLSDFSLISETPGIGLQLSFNEDYSILYGHDYNDGKWYSINTTTGSLTDLGFVTLVPGTARGFRDLGGASITSVPEPASFALMLAGGLTAAVIACRRRSPARRGRGPRWWPSAASRRPPHVAAASPARRPSEPGRP